MRLKKHKLVVSKKEMSELERHWKDYGEIQLIKMILMFEF